MDILRKKDLSASSYWKELIVRNGVDLLVNTAGGSPEIPISIIDFDVMFEKKDYQGIRNTIISIADHRNTS